MKNKHTFKSDSRTISFCSVETAESIVPNRDMALISIRGYGEANDIKYEDWKHVLKLNFDDITEEEPAPFKLFTEKQAKQLIKFVHSLPEDVRHITVHCWAGISRSGAVGKFLSGTVYPECKNDKFDQEYLFYNAYVYNMLLKSWKSTQLR